MTERFYSRREALLGAATLFASRRALAAPSAPVALACCRSYDDNVLERMEVLFDQLGGIRDLVRGRTVAIKLNLTGNPSIRYPGYLPMVTHNVHFKVVGACCHLLDKAGARRIRLVESATAPADTLEEYMLNGGWNVRALKSIAPRLEFERTHNIGQGKRYSRLKVPSGGLVFPAYDVNHSYEDTDVFVSMTKMKNHAQAGVTLSLKNVFGITPTSIYGEDAGTDEPNETPSGGRGKILHRGLRGPAKSAPQEVDPDSPREDGYRVPRVVVDLASARPIDLEIIDGVESCVGGEGPWVKGSHYISPGVLIAGRNAVCTDAVAVAVMGYDPRTERGTAPFLHSDNTLRLAEAAGLGTADLSRIDVRGAAIPDVRFDYEAHWKKPGA